MDVNMAPEDLKFVYQQFVEAARNNFSPAGL